MSELTIDRRTSNKGRSYAFRNEVLLYLHDVGFGSATSRRELKGLSSEDRIAADQGEILGLPWTIGVHASESLNLSGDLDRVSRQAATAGRDIFACISKRRGRRLEESYVTLPLETFARVLTMLHPDEVTS